MIVSIIFATSAVLGFVREAVLAGYIGVSAEYDALVVAQVIPQFLLAMLGEASMGAAVVPVFISFIAPQETKEQRRILGSAYVLLSLIFTGIGALGVVFAPQLAHVFAPGFRGSQLELTTLLMRILLPSLLFLGLSNFIVGLLHSLRSFTLAASTGIVFNVAVVLVTIPLAHRFGIVAPALGVLAGTALQLCIMLPSLIKAGLFPAAGLSFRDPALLKMARLFGPILAGALIVTMLQVADKVIGSYLPVGSLSALNFAGKIAGGPSRIFTMSVAVVLFPELVKRVADGSAERGSLVLRGMTIAAFMTLPWMGVFIALREPMTALLLQRGAFDASDTAVVAVPLAIYCLGEFAIGISTMVNNAFYSHSDSHTPTYIYIGTYVVRIGFMLALVPFMGYLAIAVGHVIVINTELVVLLVVLRRRHMPDLDLWRLAFSLLKITVASVVSGVVAVVVYAAASGAMPASTGGLLAGIALASALALIVYYVVARLLGCAEAAEVGRRLGAVFKRLIPR